MIANEPIVRGFRMWSWMQRATQQQRVAAMPRVFELTLAGEFAVQAVYPLAQATEAPRPAQARNRHGKVLFGP